MAERKPVVTTEQVRVALADYIGVKGMMGEDLTGFSFDKGIRGKGFALYGQYDNAVRSFSSKEEALDFFSRYAEIAREVMEAIGYKPEEATSSGQVETDTPEIVPETPEAIEEAPQAPQPQEGTPTAPAPRRGRRTAASTF